MTQLWDWTPRPTRTRLLHDVVAKPAVLSTPVNDQVLIYTPESREASVGEFLAQGNCDSVASTRIEPSTLITEYKIPDVITNALPSAPPCPHRHTCTHTHTRTDTHTHTHTHRQTYRQTHRQTDTQRQTDRSRIKSGGPHISSLFVSRIKEKSFRVVVQVIVRGFGR